MMSTEAFIMLIVGISIAMGGAVLLLQTGTGLQEKLPETPNDPHLRMVQVIAQNISDGTATHVRISITADGPLDLEDMQVLLRTQTEEARLLYRNGTLERNQINGFYTQ